MIENEQPRSIRPELEPDAVARRRAAEMDREFETEARSTSGALMALAAAILIVMGLGLFFWPRGDTNTNVSEKSPRVERPNVPTTPPANKPTPAPPIEAPK